MGGYKCRYLILVLVFSSSLVNYSYAQNQSNFEEEKRKWFMPDYTKLQFAGNIGFMSIGLGYDWWRSNAQTDFIYGFVPYNKGEAIIHTFTVKNTFRIHKFTLFNKFNLSPTLGFSLSIEPGENSHLKVPDKYPEGYYSSNSFYACLNAGLKSSFVFKKERNFSGIDLFCELNTLADYVYYNIKAKEDWEDDIFSLALGVNLFF